MTASISSLFHRAGRAAPCVGILLVSFLLSPVPATAHKVNLFAWVDGERIYTQSKFSGGRKAKKAAIEVYDPRGNKLLEGQTDDKGEFSFEIPQKCELKVVLRAGMGHRAEWIIPLEEIAPGMSSQPSSDPAEQTGSTQTTERPHPMMPSGPSTEEIQSAVERALDKKLKPLINVVVASRKEGPSVSDIFGGIGYIAGLVGVGAYVHSRKKKHNR